MDQDLGDHAGNGGRIALDLHDGRGRVVSTGADKADGGINEARRMADEGIGGVSGAGKGIGDVLSVQRFAIFAFEAFLDLEADLGAFVVPFPAFSEIGHDFALGCHAEQCPPECVGNVERGGLVEHVRLKRFDIHRLCDDERIGVLSEGRH
nr:hypothetical protein [Devosia aurantiaca]